MEQPPMEQLAGSRVVVTGAGRGIGRAIAAALIAEGAQVVINDLDAEACRNTAAELGAHAVPGDAASPDGVAELITAARAVLGEIDIYVANAGIETGPEPDEAGWARSWDVNVMAHVRALQALAPHWMTTVRGRFVVTASAAGLLTMPASPAYSVTKHAAVAFAEWAAITYGDHGITVQCICPLGVDTDLLPHDGPGALVLGDTVISPQAVAESVIKGLQSEEFLILPHPEVAEFYRRRATDTDRWMRGMRRVQAAIDQQLGRVLGMLGSLPR